MRYIGPKDEYGNKMKEIAANEATQRWWKVGLHSISAYPLLCPRITMQHSSMPRMSTMYGIAQTFDRCTDHADTFYQLTDGMQESFVPGTTGSSDPKGWWTEAEEVFRMEG